MNKLRVPTCKNKMHNFMKILYYFIAHESLLSGVSRTIAFLLR